MFAKRKIFTAISGSARRESTNTAFLCALALVQSPHYRVRVTRKHFGLPIFNPDQEGENTPHSVELFCKCIEESDGLIISSPEYVRALPGGLKNAIDWLVSRNEIIDKPVVLVHASHRGDDMLSSLRLILSTVTSRFDEKHFLRISLMNKQLKEIEETLSISENEVQIALTSLSPKKPSERVRLGKCLPITINV